MHIRLLADHLEVIPQVAQWCHAEWSYLHPGRTLADVEAVLRTRTNTDRIPLVLVAFDGDTLIGTVSLKVHDMEIRTDLSPWVASVYVEASRRKCGIGRQLLRAIEEKAWELGYSRLYLFTPKAEGFYAKQGWAVIERTEYHGDLVSIMEKELGNLQER